MISDPRVFISYARIDGEDLAREIYHKLTHDHNIPAWLDRFGMTGGRDWWLQIVEAIERVSFLILVATPGAMRSGVVEKEWRQAQQEGVCILPVFVSWLQPDFDGMPRWMRRAHFYNLEKDEAKLFNDLNTTCKKLRVPFMAPDLPKFPVKREFEFNQIVEQLLDTDKQSPNIVTLMLHGAGGFGKSTLAASVCHDEHVYAAFSNGVLWVTLGENPDIIANLSNLYQGLTGQNEIFVNTAQAVGRLGDKLADRDCLIVIDDVWNIAHLRPFLQGGLGCARLITSQRLDVAAQAQISVDRIIHIDEMTTNESIEMLSTGISLASHSKNQFEPLATRLDQWPILLEIANGMLHEQVALGETLESGLRWISLTLENRGVRGIARDDENQRKQSVEGVLSVSLGLLKAEDVSRFKALAIFREDVQIPLTTINILWQTDAYSTEELIKRLAGLSLLKYDANSRTASLHDVIREYLKEELGDEKLIHGNLVDNWGDKYNLPDFFAWQWYAYHLYHAGRDTMLRSLLLDFHWLQMKLENASWRLDTGLRLDSPNLRLDSNITSLIEDFNYLPTDKDLRLVQSAIQMSAHVLANNTTGFAGQLLGRLWSYYDELPTIKHLLDQARSYKEGPALLPLTASLRPAGGALLRSLTKENILPFYSHDRRLATMPDGRSIVSANGGLKIWDIETGTLLRTMALGSHGIWALALTSNGKNAIFSRFNQRVEICYLQTSEVNTVFELEEESRIYALTTTWDDRYIIAGTKDGMLFVWDNINNAMSLSFAAHNDDIFTTAVDSKSQRLITGSADGTLRVWDFNTGNLELILEGHNAAVTSATLLADGTKLISASDDTTFKLWNLDTGELMQTFEGHRASVATVAVFPDQRRIVSASFDWTLSVWDLETGDEQKRLIGHDGIVHDVIVMPDGKRVISTSEDNTIKIWDVSQNDLFFRPLKHRGAITALAVSKNGDFAITASRDATLKVWNLKTAKLQTTLTGHEDRVFDVVILSDNERAISSSNDGTLKLWNIPTGEEVYTVSVKAKVDNNTIREVTFEVRETENQIVAPTDRNGIGLWSLDTGEYVGTINRPPVWERLYITLPDRRRAVRHTGTLARPVTQLLDLETGNVIYERVGEEWGLGITKITSNGKFAVSSPWLGRVIRVWNIETGKVIRVTMPRFYRQ